MVNWIDMYGMTSVVAYGQALQLGQQVATQEMLADLLDGQEEQTALLERGIQLQQVSLEVQSQGFSAMVRGFQGVHADSVAAAQLMSTRLDAVDDQLRCIRETLSSPMATQASEYLERATLSVAQGWHDDAIRDLRAAAELVPQDYRLHRMLGDLYVESEGDYQTAIGYYRAATKYSTAAGRAEFADCSLRLAAVLDMTGDVAGALEVAGRALAAEPNTATRYSFARFAFGSGASGIVRESGVQSLYEAFVETRRLVGVSAGDHLLQRDTDGVRDALERLRTQLVREASSCYPRLAQAALACQEVEVRARALGVDCAETDWDTAMGLLVPPEPDAPMLQIEAQLERARGAVAGPLRDLGATLEADSGRLAAECKSLKRRSRELDLDADRPGVAGLLRTLMSSGERASVRATIEVASDGVSQLNALEQEIRQIAHAMRGGRIARKPTAASCEVTEYLRSLRPVALNREPRPSGHLLEAAQICVDTGIGSTSQLQRRLRIGYAQAVGLMDQLEEFGVVGPPAGSSPRDVLMEREELEALVEFDRASAAPTPYRDGGKHV